MNVFLSSRVYSRRPSFQFNFNLIAFVVSLIKITFNILESLKKKRSRHGESRKTSRKTYLRFKIRSRRLESNTRRQIYRRK